MLNFIIFSITVVFYMEFLEKLLINAIATQHCGIDNELYNIQFFTHTYIYNYMYNYIFLSCFQQKTFSIWR